MKDVIGFAMFVVLLPILIVAIGVRVVAGVAVRGWEIGSELSDWLF